MTLRFSTILLFDFARHAHEIQLEMEDPRQIRKIQTGAYFLFLLTLQFVEASFSTEGIGNRKLSGSVSPAVEFRVIPSALGQAPEIFEEINSDVHHVLKTRKVRNLEDYKTCKSQQATAAAGVDKLASCLESLFSGNSETQGQQPMTATGLYANQGYGNQNPGQQQLGEWSPQQQQGYSNGVYSQGQYPYGGQQQYYTQQGQQGLLGQYQQFPNQQGQQGQFQPYSNQQGQQGQFQPYSNQYQQYPFQQSQDPYSGGIYQGMQNQYGQQDSNAQLAWGSNTNGIKYPGIGSYFQQGQQGQQSYLNNLVNRLPMGQQQSTGALGAGALYTSKRSEESRLEPKRTYLQSTKPFII